jgi:hypothetical protein
MFRPVSLSGLRRIGDAQRDKYALVFLKGVSANEIEGRSAFEKIWLCRLSVLSEMIADADAVASRNELRPTPDGREFGRLKIPVYAAHAALP